MLYIYEVEIMSTERKSLAAELYYISYPRSRKV